MLDPDIQALVVMGDLIAATSLYQQRFGGSVLVARKTIDGAHWELTQSRGSSAGHQAPLAATLVIDPAIAAFLREDRKIEAIKRYRELYGVGLKEAKDAVEAMQDGTPLPTPTPVIEHAPLALQPELDRLIAAGQKIGAIKHYREVTQVGLKEAKDAVEAHMDKLAGVAHAEPGLQPELDRLIRANMKINAIKHYRTLTNAGLKEAKDAVEARMAELGL
nr:ribosomal protein L7/L12 [Nannocystis sp.]